MGMIFDGQMWYRHPGNPRGGSWCGGKLGREDKQRRMGRGRDGEKGERRKIALFSPSPSTVASPIVPVSRPLQDLPLGLRGCDIGGPRTREVFPWELLFSLFLHAYPVGQGDWQGKDTVSLLHTPNFSYCSTNVQGSPLASAQSTLFKRTLSKADTSLNRTVALVPRVSALERVDCIDLKVNTRYVREPLSFFHHREKNRAFLRLWIVIHGIRPSLKC